MNARRRIPPTWLRRGLFPVVLASLAQLGPLRAEDPQPTRQAATVKPEPGCDCCAATSRGKVSKRYAREIARYRLPEVVLLDTDGREIPLSCAIDGDGPVMLQFIFTTCPTICGALSGTFSSVQGALGGELSNARLVSISIDPEHDRPERLQRYAKELKAGPNWKFYTGRREDVIAIQKAFDAYQVNKMSHQPLTFLRPKRGAPWVRLTGLLGAADLTAEYREMLKP